MEDEKIPAKKTPRSAPVPAPVPDPIPEPVREELVWLFLEHPHTEFDLSGMGLEKLIPEGTAYSLTDADLVRMMCLKYKIRYREGQ
jgi:hypothetical protein